jgi:pyridoxamine 5'-phosphate oxidase
LGSQIGAAVSNQSQVICNRDILTEKELKLKEEFAGNDMKKMAKPESWGGFRVLPHTFEFWQGQSTRLHDRIRFRKAKKNDEEIDPKMTLKGQNGWLIERLSP